ncbi:hypothetical protein LCGC14_0312390 [marine sediment metagenome]|uniref:Squalene cyclase C-terminal domain-containing protein n=1 Tax=marine sediment metagenome TaxID=412755 RepID=A0A0F9U496_9ZZZZ
MWIVATCLTAVAATGCAGPSGRVIRIDAALAEAGRYMIAAQSPDGAWRSATYGCFKADPALTPHVMSCLFFLPQTGDGALASFRRGAGYLSGFVGDDGRLDVGRRELLFPTFTAAAASRVVVLERKTPRALLTQRAWLAYVLDRQLTERLGWRPADREYGGWGFALDVPRKPAPGRRRERFFESNLVATVYGVAALHSADTPVDDAAFGQILTFARKCQNVSDDPSRADPAFDDGGFYFIPDDEVQNKAGVAGIDRFGRKRFASYGTMTADGVRVLIRCGLGRDHPRVVAARRWLERNFSATQNPGVFAADREEIRNATYYYWTWAVSHAFLALRARQIESPDGPIRWAEVLADEILRRQRPDGSWVNGYTDAKEDDPLVATPFAAAALAICRAMMTGEYATIDGRCVSVRPGRRRSHPQTASR